MFNYYYRYLSQLPKKPYKKKRKQIYEADRFFAHSMNAREYVQACSADAVVQI